MNHTCVNTYVVFLLNTTITSTSSVNVTTSWVVTEKLCNTSHYRIIKWHKKLHISCLHKATFHYSRQLQTWSKTRFLTRFANRFSTSSCGFATCFRHFFVENLVANLLHQSPHVKIDAAGSQQVRWVCLMFFTNSSQFSTTNFWFNYNHDNIHSFTLFSTSAIQHRKTTPPLNTASDQTFNRVVRVLDKWNVEKTRFKPANKTVEAGFSLRVLFSCLSWCN